jgi:hypothetical protein
MDMDLPIDLVGGDGMAIIENGVHALHRNTVEDHVMLKSFPVRSRREVMRSAVAVLLSANFGLYSLISAAAPPANEKGGTSTPKPASKTTVSENSTDPQTAIATLAGGCFWCTEAVFERMEGVQDVVSGYIGGQVPNPSYQAVCTGMTGHAEAVQIKYDPSKTTLAELLEVFFATSAPNTAARSSFTTTSRRKSLKNTSLN